jgi:hypothetical protein
VKCFPTVLLPGNRYELLAVLFAEDGLELAPLQAPAAVRPVDAMMANVRIRATRIEVRSAGCAALRVGVKSFPTALLPGNRYELLAVLFAEDRLELAPLHAPAAVRPVDAMMANATSETSAMSSVYSVRS